MGRGNRSKAIGTSQGETPAVRFARLNGFPEADRIQLRGTQDASDVRLCHDVVFQMKVRGAYAPLLTPTRWLRQTDEQALRYGASVGFLLVRPRGMGETRVGFWHVWTSAYALARLHVPTREIEVDLDAPEASVRLAYLPMLRLLEHAGYGAEERDRAERVAA